MKLRKILLPTDFSALSDTALVYAAALARDAKGTLFVVHVEEPPAVYGTGDFYYGQPSPAPDEIMRMLHRVRPASDEVQCEHRLLAGDPAEAICEFAQREKIDLIVIGTHGRTGLARLLLGSVGERVLRSAPCPAICVKASQKQLEDRPRPNLPPKLT